MRRFAVSMTAGWQLMAKRKSVRREVAEIKAKGTREMKRKMFGEVCGKGRVETPRDIISVFFGLSRKAVENAAYMKIHTLAAMGYTPLEIVRRMEGKISQPGSNADNKV
jgi:hypothetical protein